MLFPNFIIYCNFSIMLNNIILYEESMGEGENLISNRVLKISIISIMLLVSGVVLFNVVPVVAHLDYQVIAPDSVSITEKNNNITELSLDSTGILPPSEKFAHVGFGWLYDEYSGYVAVTHRGTVDSTQRPHGWHTHNVVLEDAPIVGSITHCIVSITNNDHAGLAINQDTIKLNVKNSNFADSFMDPPTAIAFDIMPDRSCPDLTEKEGSGVGIGVHQIEPEIAAAAEEGGGGQGGGPKK